MPKYEIGYILSSGVSDDEVPGVAAEISKSVESLGATILNEDHWGRKKLAYPIGRTRNGYYVFMTADVASEKVIQIEHKLNTMEPVIRFMIVNLTDADHRKEKDEEARARRPRRDPEQKTEEQAEAKTGNAATSQVDIEQEIDKAISSEEEKV